MIVEDLTGREACSPDAAFSAFTRVFDTLLATSGSTSIFSPDFASLNPGYERRDTRARSSDDAREQQSGIAMTER
jgi:hypothetical protein